MRQYLTRPELQRYFREQKKILVEAITAGNPAALKDLRDNSGNAMARVNVARAIELMQNEMDEPKYNHANQSPQVPGFVIIVTGKELPPADLKPDGIFQFEWE